jgi:HAD superfamily hydrolase (TIGR01493 family)
VTLQPIEAVLFDLHSTLLDQGASAVWTRAAAHRLAIPESDLGDPQVHAVLDTLWDHAKAHDPHSRRDLSPVDHRRVFDELVAAAGLTLPRPVLDALYAEQFAAWHAYDDTVATLRALREAGVRVAVVSNICHDIRWLLAREGILPLVETVVLSFEVGVVKPDRRIFAAALDGLGGIAPERALMVGDAWRDDGAAAGYGIRSLVLPRTSGRVHGLSVVIGAVLASAAP